VSLTFLCAAALAYYALAYRREPAVREKVRSALSRLPHASVRGHDGSARQVGGGRGDEKTWSPRGSANET
jgi:hypothetical protein